MPRALEVLREVGAPSFLTVLKRFGPSNPAPLSFPIPGWTLAADVPAAVPGLPEVLDQLDAEVAEAGGRLYLAKDSRQSAMTTEKTMTLLKLWTKARARCDPNAKLTSALSQRVGLISC